MLAHLRSFFTAAVLCRMNLITRLWNTSLASLTRGVKRRLDERKLQPGWTKIRAGVLEGAELLLPQGTSIWAQFIAGDYDQFLIDALLASHNPRGKVVWDIGAHVGYHSLAFAAMGADVVAFEPNATNVTQLELNLKRNPSLGSRVRHLLVAVSDADGQISFKQSDDLSGESTGGHVRGSLPPLEPAAYARFHETLVPCIKIETLLGRGEPPPDIIKIDVEGAEELVLKGGANFLSEHHPILLMEIHHICLMFGIQKLLLSWGYSTRLLDQEHASPSRCFIIAEK
jgi:FkbM family methyltransferase